MWKLKINKIGYSPKHYIKSVRDDKLKNKTKII